MGAAKERDPKVYGSWLISYVQRYLLVQARMKLIFQLLVSLGDQFEWFDVAIWTESENTKYGFLWSMNQHPLSYPDKYFKRIMQEFWLHELLVSSSTLESGPLWFRKRPSIIFMLLYKAEMFHN